MQTTSTTRRQTAFATDIIQAFIISPLVSVGVASMILGLDTFGTLLFIAYALACILGIPAYFILRTLNWLNIWSCLITGYLMSVSGLFLILCLFGQMNSGDDLFTLFFCPYHLITLFGVLIFWWIAVEAIDDNEPAS